MENMENVTVKASYSLPEDAFYWDGRYYNLYNDRDTWEEPVFTNWNANEPNSATVEEDYAAFYSRYDDGTWNDASFGSGTWYICEWIASVEGTTLWEYGGP